MNDARTSAGITSEHEQEWQLQTLLALEQVRHLLDHQQERSRLISEALRAENDVESEQLLRITVLELLYARRRTEPRSPGIFFGDIEGLVGRPREHLEFTFWYLGQKKFIDRTDGSQILITAAGVDYLEQNSTARQKVLRLTAAQPVAT